MSAPAALKATLGLCAMITAGFGFIWVVDNHPEIIIWIPVAIFCSYAWWGLYCMFQEQKS